MIADLNKIAEEWSYRVGVIDYTDETHLYHLNEILREKGWTRQVIDEINQKLTEDDIVKNKKSGNTYVVKTHNPDTQDLIKKDASDDEIEKVKKGDDGDTQTKEIPKVLKKIFDGSQNSVRDGLLYMDNNDKKLFKNFKDDFVKLQSNPSKELAQKMVNKYGLEASSGAKPKVYIRNINFEARKILGQNKATEFIKDTIESALKSSLKGATKGVNVKQEVMTTSKPDLETKRTAKEDNNVKSLFKQKPYDRLNPNFHQVFGPIGKDGNLLYPSSKHSKQYLQQSLAENNSVKRTIEKLKELENTENVSPKISEALEKHQTNMESILKNYKVPSKKASQAIGDSYAKMAETINVESPTLAGAMMKNLAEFALYDTEVAAGEEVYLPSDGSFPSGDKLKVTRKGGKVERVASVSVKYGRSGKYGSFGFPGETGQYQKYHPNPEYRDRLNSRPGDTGYELGVKDDIVQSDKQMGKIIDESGLGDVITDTKGVLSVIRENLSEIQKLKQEIDFEQKPKRNTGKPPAWKQLNIHKDKSQKIEKELSDKMKKFVDRDKLNKLVGSDNASVIMSRPGCMVTALTFASTLRTSNGLDVIEHNHQEIKEGKYESHTDTAEDGTMDIKNWKLTWRAWDSRAGGLIGSFNSERKEL